MGLNELQNLGTDVFVVNDGADFLHFPFLVGGSGWVVSLLAAPNFLPQAVAMRANAANVAINSCFFILNSIKCYYELLCAHIGETHLFC